MPAAPNNIVPVIILSFFGWRMVSRVQRNIGRQLLKPARLYLRIGIYAVLTLFLTFAMVMAGSPLPAFGGLMGGLGLGAVLGMVGLNLTQFETTAAARFYTPHPYIGVAVSLLLVGRLAYRYLALNSGGSQPAGNPQLVLSPLTLLFYGLLAGYYIAYFIGVLFKSKNAPQAP